MIGLIILFVMIVVLIPIFVWAEREDRKNAKLPWNPYDDGDW